MIIPSDMVGILQLRQVDNYLAEVDNIFEIIESDIPDIQKDRIREYCSKARTEVKQLIEDLGEEVDKKFLEDLYGL